MVGEGLAVARNTTIVECAGVINRKMVRRFVSRELDRCLIYHKLSKLTPIDEKMTGIQVALNWTTHNLFYFIIIHRFGQSYHESYLTHNPPTSVTFHFIDALLDFISHSSHNAC